MKFKILHHLPLDHLLLFPDWPSVWSSLAPWASVLPLRPLHSTLASSLSAEFYLCVLKCLSLLWNLPLCSISKQWHAPPCTHLRHFFYYSAAFYWEHDWVLVSAVLLAGRWPTFHCDLTWRESYSVSSSSFACKGTRSDQGCTLITSLTSVISLKGLPSSSVTWGRRALTYEFRWGGHNSVHSKTGLPS